MGVESTCQRAGSRERYCELCGAYESETLAKLAHVPGEAIRENEVAATCMEAGGHDEVVRCSVCGEGLSRFHVEESALGHEWGAWEITRMPSATAPGEQVRTCLRCAETERQEMARLPQNDISYAAVTVANATYDGREQRPAPEVVLEGKTLVPDIDYTVLAWRDNVDAGEAVVVLAGMGSYTGTVRKAFEIAPANLAGSTIAAIPDQVPGAEPEPMVTLFGRALSKGRDYELSYSDNDVPGTATVIVAGKGNYTGKRSATFGVVAPEAKAPSVSYRTNIQREGWQGWKRDGEMSGTSGKSLRLEGIELALAGVSGSVEYRTHVQSHGWMGWVSDGKTSGTSGQGKRLEAIQIRLTGDVAKTHDIWYRVHAQSVGWMGWAKNGTMAGTASHAWRLEAIEVRLVEKGGTAPGATSGAYLDAAGYLSGMPDEESAVLYRTHVQRDGWQNFMRDGEASGTSGRSLRLEAVEMRLGGAAGDGSIEYRAHVQTYGWQGWSRDGALAGTSGEGKRLEAVQIRLSGAAASRYDVWYRVHAQHFGWLGWSSNGASAGTEGFGYRLEAMEVRLLPKGSDAPGSTDNAFRRNENADAHAAYARLVKSLAQRAAATGYSRGIDANYRYADVYGDYVDELLVATMESGGSGSTLRIYTYEGGKTRLMLEDGFYGDNEYRFHKDSSSFVQYCSGHGGERYNYYAATDGTYRKLATRARVSTAGGGAYNGPWAYTSYTGSTGSSVTEAVFGRIVANVEKGTATVLTPSWEWQTMKA